MTFHRMDLEVGSSNPPSANFFFEGEFLQSDACWRDVGSIQRLGVLASLVSTFFCQLLWERPGLLFKGTRQGVGLIVKLGGQICQALTFLEFFASLIKRFEVSIIVHVKIQGSLGPKLSPIWGFASTFVHFGT